LFGVGESRKIGGKTDKGGKHEEENKGGKERKCCEVMGRV
jgi:hypothetical protein